MANIPSVMDTFPNDIKEPELLNGKSQRCISFRKTIAIEIDKPGAFNLSQTPVTQSYSLEQISDINLIKDQVLFIYRPKETKNDIDLNNWCSAQGLAAVYKEKHIQIYTNENLYLVVGPQDLEQTFADTFAAYINCVLALQNLEKLTSLKSMDIADDVKLVHKVDKTSLHKWPDLQIKTENTYMLRLLANQVSQMLWHCLRSGTKHKDLPDALEVFVQADQLEARVDTLVDKIEILDDLYSTANDRLSEYSFFREECRLEIIIIVILLLELVIACITLMAG